MEAVQAALDPTPPNAKATSSAVVPLNEGDVLSVRSREGQEIWRGVLTFLRWPFAKQALPSGWERWFELELPATLLERGRLPCWRRGRERRFLVPANAERRR